MDEQGSEVGFMASSNFCGAETPRAGRESGFRPEADFEGVAFLGRLAKRLCLVEFPKA